MIWIQHALLEWQRTLQPSARSGIDPRKLLAQFSDLDHRVRAAQAKLIGWWTFAFGIAVAGGLIGTAILLGSFIYGLLNT